MYYFEEFCQEFACSTQFIFLFYDSYHCALNYSVTYKGEV